MISEKEEKGPSHDATKKKIRKISRIFPFFCEFETFPLKKNYEKIFKNHEKIFKKSLKKSKKKKKSRRIHRKLRIKICRFDG